MNNLKKHILDIDHLDRDYIYKILEKTKTSIGLTVIKTELLMGVDNSIPLKKQSIFNAIPKKEHNNILGKSFNETFCFGIKKLTAQKRTVAPRRRSLTKPKP